MGFLEVKPEIFRTFLRNSGKVFRQFFGIFVARPTAAHKPERATAIYSCLGICTDRFIFRLNIPRIQTSKGPC